MTRVATQIGPADAGRRMSLAEFEYAEGAPGFLYELSKGVVTVMDVPAIPHALQIDATDIRALRQAGVSQRAMLWTWSL